MPTTSAKPTDDPEELLFLISKRLGAVKKGAEVDYERAARFFVKWWREGGAVSSEESNGWGFDFDFASRAELADHLEWGLDEKIDKVVETFVEKMKNPDAEAGMSPTREKRIAQEEKKASREKRRQAAFEAKSTTKH